MHKHVTRRKLIQWLTAFSASLAAGPLVPALASAKASEDSSDTRMVAQIFFESYATIAFQHALRYAGKDGFVASMPQLLHARSGAGYENIIWNTWFTANSEENVLKTPIGNQVLITVHGGGIFGLPGRFESSLRADLDRSNTQGLTGQYAARISELEARNLLEGKIAGKDEIPVYPFNEFKKGIKDLPMRYAVVMDFIQAKQSARGYTSFDVLKDDALMITRAGGLKPLAAYLEKAQARHHTKQMGNSHSFHRIDPDEPQSRILNLGGNRGGVGSEGKDQGLGWGYDSDDGMGSGWPAGLARYVAVAPRDASASLRDLDFGL